MNQTTQNPFQKAQKSQAKLRLAIFGISGSGKTWTALAIASGLGKKVSLIDTERKSASKYADDFDFDTVDLPSHKIEDYISHIEMAEQNGYDVLIIDSLSHGWQELVQEVELISKAKFKGNYWAAWSEGTPKQKKFINTILGFDGHIIATMRTKTEYIIQDDGSGKKKPVRVGLQPEQGKNIEYEFDMLMEISSEHIINVLKDRTHKFQDKIIEKPGKALGEELLAWLNSGKAVKKTEPKKTEPEKKKEGEGTTYTYTKEVRAKIQRMFDFFVALSDGNITGGQVRYADEAEKLDIPRRDMLSKYTPGEHMQVWMKVKAQVVDFEEAGKKKPE